MNDFDLIPLLEYINPDDYGVWTKVGMALKHEGYSCSDWDAWSSRSGKYTTGLCEQKWNSFNEETSTIVTGGTITELAKQGGWVSSKKEHKPKFLAFDAIIGSDKVKSIVEEGFVEKEALPLPPRNWDPVEQLKLYITTLFQMEDIIGYNTESRKTTNKEGKEKFQPVGNGIHKLQASVILDRLDKSPDNIENAIGPYNHECGAWIRFNPLDGNGIKDENVTEFRYALIECDEGALEEQYALIKQMRLPVAVLVHSGNKSLHAVVRIGAENKAEYTKNVRFLYETCEKSGLKIDKQNKNASRLSRMPGIERNGNKQYIIATNIGCETWEDWVEYVTLLDNDLPDPEKLSDLLVNPPALAEEAIEGILRQGHKMLISGASKAGKSFLLIELCLAIGTGTQWLNWKCKQGRVLYINLEIDRASCFDRFCKILKAKGMSSEVFDNVEIMNLRGKAAPMDKLVDRIILKAKDKGYSVIIIDPLYKVITGDENTASDMAHFMNQFDKLAEALGCSVICCHHHSKGAQGDKRVADRASGSGVFARDTDALLDMVELEVSPELRTQILNQKLCEAYLRYFEDTKGEEWVAEQSDVTKSNASVLERFAETWKEKSDLGLLRIETEKITNALTAWRVEGTLREFPGFLPVDMWFGYPIHTVDTEGFLKNTIPVGSINPHIKGGEASKKACKEKAQNDDLRLRACFDKLSAEHEIVTQPMLTDAFNESKAEDGEKALSRTTISKKIDDSKYLCKVDGGKDEKGGTLPNIIKRKELELHTEFPEGFV